VSGIHLVDGVNVGLTRSTDLAIERQPGRAASARAARATGTICDLAPPKLGDFVQNVEMNTSPRPTVLARLWLGLQRAADDTELGKYLLGWIAPALFALLVSISIRLHSLEPLPTMARAVGNLLALSAVGLLLLWSRGRRFSLPRDVALLLLALAAAVAVSVLGSGNADISLLRLELYLSVALLATVFYLTYRDQPSLPLEAYFLGIAVVHLPFLLSAILWIKDLGPPFWTDRVYRVAHFANVRQFAECGFFAAVSATGLGLLSRRLVVPSFLLAAGALFGLIMTGSRGATLSWLVFVALACCFSQARLRAAVHGLVVLALAGGLVWYLDRLGWLPSPNIFARVASEQVGEERFDNSRLELWLLSMRQIAVHPLFGSGPEGYWLSGCCNPRVMQAHNFVLQFLMEFGVVGCAIVLLLAARAVKGLGGPAAVAKLTVATPSNRVLACLLMSFIAYSLVDQTMYHLLPLLHFALFAGLFAASLTHARAAPNPVVLPRD
jgi:O-antigen ligase